MVENKNKLNDISELKEVFRKEDCDVYIYGAGKYAKVVLGFLFDNNLLVKSVLVSNARQNPGSIYGIPVEEYTDNAGIIIVCMNEHMHAELDDILEKNNLDFSLMNRFFYFAQVFEGFHPLNHFLMYFYFYL